MSFENEKVLNEFIKRQQPVQCKVDGESCRTIYRCHNDFGALDGREIKNMVHKIADFGLATRLDKPSTRNGTVGKQLGSYPIQPDYYRAPEVILGCGWDFKADIWNFGVLVRSLQLFSGGGYTIQRAFCFLSFGTVAGLGLILMILFVKLWNILGSKELFQQVRDTNGQYNAKSHLVEMIVLLGTPPPRDCSQNKGPCQSTTGRSLSQMTPANSAIMLVNFSMSLPLTLKMNFSIVN